MVFCAYGFEALGDRLIRWALVPVAMVLGVALLRTDSQAGLVALGVALLLALVFSGDLRRRAAWSWPPSWWRDALLHARDRAGRIPDDILARQHVQS